MFGVTLIRKTEKSEIFLSLFLITQNASSFVFENHVNQ